MKNKNLEAWVALKMQQPDRNSVYVNLYPAMLSYVNTQVEFLQRANEYLYRQMKEKTNENANNS